MACVAAYRRNNTVVEPIHVLLGIGEEGGGVAAHVLNSLRITLADLRSATQAPGSLVRPPPDQSPPLHPSLSDATHELLHQAAAEAIALDHGFLGSEHLLLAFDSSCQLTPTFGKLGVEVGHVRKEVLSIIGNRPA